MVNRLPMVNARANLSNAVNSAKFGGNFTILTARNKPVAVIVSVEFYEQALKDRARIESLEK